MRQTIKVAFAAFALAVSLVGYVAAGPLDEALAAYNRKDYATAMRLLQPVADQGNEVLNLSLHRCTTTAMVCRRTIRRR
jgi:hypothetical protein